MSNLTNFFLKGWHFICRVSQPKKINRLDMRGELCKARYVSEPFFSLIYPPYNL
jgi:hypothetical protein